MGAIAMILGSVMAIAQSDLKRMLAYSSVAQIGYIVLGVGLANAMGLTGGLLHLVSHAIMKGCLFLVAGAIVYRTGIREIRASYAISRSGCHGPLRRSPSPPFPLIGIPPTSGFFSKLYLILGAIDAGQWLFVAVILFSSVLALTYFVNVIRHMYFSVELAPADGAGGARAFPSPPVRDEAPLTMLVPMLTLAAAIVLLGLFNGEVVSRFVEPAVAAAGIGR